MSGHNGGVLAALGSLVLLVFGAALLTLGAEAFTEHVREAASRLGVSTMALGILLAGAEPEEAVTTMIASGQGHPGLAAGGAVGANLVILTLTLGLATLFSRLPISRGVLEYAAAAVAAGVLSVLFLWNGVMGRVEGSLLALVYVSGVVWVWRRENQPPAIGGLAELSTTSERSSERSDANPESARPLLLVLIGLLGMIAGGFLAVRGAQGLIGVFELTGSVIGLTVLGLATSAEMVALVWAAHRRGVSELVVAAAVGAVAYNATVSIGLGALVSPLAIGKGSPVLMIGLLTVVLPLLLFTGARTGTLPRALGVVLLGGYVLATGWLFAL